MTDAAPERIWVRPPDTFLGIFDDMGVWYSGQQYSAPDLEFIRASAVQAMIDAERERCAKIAEAVTAADGQHNIKDQWRADIGRDIASAIRGTAP